MACFGMRRRRPSSAGPAPKRRSGPWVGAPGSCPENPWTIVATKVTGAGGTAGATGAMAIRALTFARLGPRRREGRAAPRRNHKANAMGAASEAEGLSIEGRAAPGGFMRQAMPPEFSPAADAAGAGYLSPCPQALQGQLWGGRYPAPSITLPKRSQLCPFQRCNCIWRMTL